MPTIEVNGETLSYGVDGEGPAVILLHGVGAMGSLWADTVDVLRKRFTAYAFDLRGHGASSQNGALAGHDMARDLAAAVKSLDLEAYHLVGASLGAAVAVILAASAPEGVRSLFVSGIGLSPDQALHDEVYGVREAVHYLAEEDFAYQIAEALLVPDAPQASIDGLRDGILKQTKQGYLKGLEALQATDLAATAPKVSAPALVLHGNRDELVPPAQARALAEAFANGSFSQLEDAGQIAYLDNPAGFAAALAAHLDRVN